MNRALTKAVLSAIIAASAPGTVLAESFSWYDESPARDSLGQRRAPVSLFDRDKRLSFGVQAYKSLAQDTELTGDPEATITLYGEFAKDYDAYAPISALNRSPLESQSRLSGLGIKWRHRVDSSNTVSVTAGYSELPATALTPNGSAPIDTRASLSWNSVFSGDWRPGVTGSVFVGDNVARDDSYRRLGNPYYGFSLGGQLQLWQTHTPYFSYRMQRNWYQPDEFGDVALWRDQQRSQIAAGWLWQLQRNWSLQAEASYGLNGATLDPYSPDRGRIFFGTRFDLR